MEAEDTESCHARHLAYECATSDHVARGTGCRVLCCVAGPRRSPSKRPCEERPLSIDLGLLRTARSLAKH